MWGDKMDYLNDNKSDVELVIKEKINKVIKKLCKDDNYLLEHSASERSISHRFARYLEEQFAGEGWDIDCEYNRLGEAEKKLYWREFGEKPNLVLPDIIVHHRGKTENLLVIEIEKTIQYDHTDKDFKKLKAFLSENDYRYRFSLFLKFNTGADFKENGCINSNNIIFEKFNEVPVQ